MKIFSHNQTFSYSFTALLLTLAFSLPSLSAEGLFTDNREYKLVNVINYGATPNDNTNDTAAIQRAIDAVPTNGIVYVPAGKYMINAKVSLKLKSNMHFRMSDDATLAAIPNNVPRYYVLSVAGVTNVEISGGKILGERDQHITNTNAAPTLSPDGEWGYGINVGRKSIDGTVYPNASSKIYIHDIHISKFWGDGIQIGGGANDVEIRRVVSTQNRRQGMSITRAENIRVYNSEFSYTNGTSPEAGIDVEPDPNDDPNLYYARNILIENCRFNNNKGSGVLLYKESSDVTIRASTFKRNTYGVYTVKSSNGLIAGNTFAHNKYHGVAIRGGSEGFELRNNIYRNNSTVAFGENTEMNPLTTITGELPGASGTAPHVDVPDALEDVNAVLTNQYAR